MARASSKPRLERIKSAETQYPRTKYRQALGPLLRETNEDWKTGRLVGRTHTGKWHIEILDLNADHLVQKRRDRTRLRNTFLAAALASGTDSTDGLIREVLAKLAEAQASMLPVMIPELPAA